MLRSENIILQALATQHQTGGKHIAGVALNQ